MEASKASPSHDSHSPAVTSRAGMAENNVNEVVRGLAEKLSAALVNVSAKEDLVKQHAKVAEEAVAGWEKAENEAAILKERLEVAIQQKISLEDRVSHLDGALKECVRQLRQGREEQEHKIHEAVVKATKEWESTKTELENQILEFQKKVDALENQPPADADPYLFQKLELLDQENSSLRLELQQQNEELEIRTIERDLSTQAAEAASKQNLESIKRVAKLEAECRKLRIVATKSPLRADNKSATASSIYVESLTDSQSDSGDRFNIVEMSNAETEKSELGRSDTWASAQIAELNQFKSEKGVDRTSVEIDLMDDFLEMERLAALAEVSREGSEAVPKESVDARSSVREELDIAVNHAAELVKKLEKLEKEKAELHMALAESQISINASELQLRAQLDMMTNSMIELEAKKEQLEKEKAELQIALSERQISINASEIQLKAELYAAMNHTIELEAKNEQLEKEKAELQMALAESQIYINASEVQLRTELDAAISCTIELQAKKEQLEKEKAELRLALTATGDSREALELKLSEGLAKIEELQKELKMANEEKQAVESQLRKLEIEARVKDTRVGALEEEVKKVRALSDELMIKSGELEEELERKKEELDSQGIASLNGQSKIKQEDLDVAAGRLAECQKTIVSLRKQLESLATLEDFLIDTTNIPELTAGGSVVSRANGEMWKLHSNRTFSPKRDANSLKMPGDSPCPSLNPSDTVKSPASSSSSVSSAVPSAQVSLEKNRNGFAKFFSRTKNGIQLEI
ncbi:filament-like plant protein 1 isoform X2 [Rhodamnia argentea]|uniref:Filament-like plant protein 1 isoform X2 n=1 Tax=Rhodamnia argentea TaxID=178133 RepID=A0A8B8QDL1_9MYRT|nr:filament-like plant protein 1 isoform X2 [Rhodamnia argentea]